MNTRNQEGITHWLMINNQEYQSLVPHWAPQVSYYSEWISRNSLLHKRANLSPSRIGIHIYTLCQTVPGPLYCPHVYIWNGVEHCISQLFYEPTTLTKAHLHGLYSPTYIEKPTRAPKPIYNELGATTNELLDMENTFISITEIFLAMGKKTCKLCAWYIYTYYTL